MDIWTFDPRSMEPLLYNLSYPAMVYQFFNQVKFEVEARAKLIQSWLFGQNRN